MLLSSGAPYESACLPSFNIITTHGKKISVISKHITGRVSGDIVTSMGGFFTHMFLHFVWQGKISS